MKIIEVQLKELILKKYKSVKQFAEEINIPYTTIQGILKRGINNAGIKKVSIICIALGIDTDALAAGYIKERQTNHVSINPPDQDYINFMNKYRTLSDYDQETVDIVIHRLYRKQKISNK